MAKGTASTGRALEKRVADNYRQLGARKVEHDVLLVGNQIDVYVELEMPDRSLHRVAVEAKEWTRPVGIDVVNSFALIVKLLHSEWLIDEGIIVSTSCFSRQARDAAETYHIRLLELSDLDAMVARAKSVERPRPAFNTVYQLPLPPGDFTGRTSQLAELGAMVESGATVLGLFGVGGVGKTTLALKLAEQLAPRYPDAQFYLDLKGTSSKPLSAAEAMAHVIRAYYPTIGLPEHEAELRGMYQLILNNKRALLLMDNASCAEQVEPLALPESCLLLVTAREYFKLPAPYDKFMELAPMPPADACALLLTIAPHIGDQAGQIARLCGYLPLSLRLVGSTLMTERRDVTTVGVVGHLRQLTDGRERLELIEASLALGYESLDAEIQKRWRMLSVFPDAFDRLAAEMVWDLEPDLTQNALSELVKHGMVKWDPTTASYRLHDIERHFAAGRITEVDQRELDANVAKSLTGPARRYESALIAAECLLNLEWRPVKMRSAVLDALRELMCSDQVPELERRTAASLLMRLRWLDGVSPDEMIACVELIGRYVYSTANRRYLVQSITSVLDSDSITLSERQRVQMLLYRAIMLGKLGKLEELDRVVQDYEQVKRFISQLINSPNSLPEDYKVAARADLGLGNIAVIRAEMLTEPENPHDHQRELLQEAVRLYWSATKLARVYGQDVILEVTIYRELSYAYALLRNWAESERCYRVALEILERGKDDVESPEVYAERYAWTLERAIDVHLKKGQSLVSQGSGSQALAEYETAYKLADEEFTVLKRSAGKSEDLIVARVIAHINSGDCLWAMTECPGCDEPPPLKKKACMHWRTALDVAHHLGVLDLAQVARGRLDRHCPGGVE